MNRIVTLVFCAVSFALPAKSETLADALINAYQHSGLLERNRATLRAADEDVAQAVALLRPQLNYLASVTGIGQRIDDPGRPAGIGTPAIASSSSFETDITASLAITADLLLYDGGVTRLAQDVAKETVLITREALRSAEQQVLLNAVLAYTGVREAVAIVNLRQNNVNLITQELQAARDRFEVGEVTRTDVAIAEARLAEARNQLTGSLGDLALAREQFRNDVGRAPGDLAPPPTPAQPASSPEEAYAVARRLNPDMLQAMRRVTLAEINVRRAEAAVNPRLSLTGRAGINQDGNESASVGLELSGPIYQGGQITSLYRQAVANRDGTRADLHTTRHAVDQNLAAAWTRLQVAQATIAATDAQIRAATVAFRGVQEEAKLGARTTLDVLDAEQELLDARATAIMAGIDRINASYSLLFAMGLMTVDHLNLGIVTYDPEAYYQAVRTAPVRKVSPRGKKLDSLLKSLGRE